MDSIFRIVASRSGKTEFNIGKRVDGGAGATQQLTRAFTTSFFGYIPKSISSDVQAVPRFALIWSKEHYATEIAAQMNSYSIAQIKEQDGACSFVFQELDRIMPTYELKIMNYFYAALFFQ